MKFLMLLISYTLLNCKLGQEVASKALHSSCDVIINRSAQWTSDPQLITARQDLMVILQRSYLFDAGMWSRIFFSTPNPDWNSSFPSSWLRFQTLTPVFDFFRLRLQSSIFLTRFDSCSASKIIVCKKLAFTSHPIGSSARLLYIPSPLQLFCIFLSSICSSHFLIRSQYHQFPLSP